MRALCSCRIFRFLINRPRLDARQGLSSRTTYTQRAEFCIINRAWRNTDRVNILVLSYSFVCGTKMFDTRSICFVGNYTLVYTLVDVRVLPWCTTTYRVCSFERELLRARIMLHERHFVPHPPAPDRGNPNEDMTDRVNFIAPVYVRLFR